MTNFKNWSKKYYPGENEEVLHKMSHAWAAASINLAFSDVGINSEKPSNNQIQSDGLIVHCKKCALTGKCEGEPHAICSSKCNSYAPPAAEL